VFIFHKQIEQGFSDFFSGVQLSEIQQFQYRTNMFYIKKKKKERLKLETLADSGDEFCDISSNAYVLFFKRLSLLCFGVFIINAAYQKAILGVRVMDDTCPPVSKTITQRTRMIHDRFLLLSYQAVFRNHHTKYKVVQI
jgi:hypothetical protein